jgi:hypothetical protein
MVGITGSDWQPISGPGTEKVFPNKGTPVNPMAAAAEIFDMNALRPVRMFLFKIFFISRYLTIKI